VTPSGSTRRAGLARVVSLLVIAAAVVVAVWALDRSRAFPSTDDATIDADVVHVAASVGGRIIDLPVRENQRVAKGDVLFRLDPVPFRLAVAQAEADLALALAQLETQRRAITRERAAADVAAQQVGRATDNLDLSTRTVARLRPLAAQGYVPQQQLDTAQTGQRDAVTSVAQARVQADAAERAIDTDDAALAAAQAREAALGIARRAQEDSVLRASEDGRIVGLSVAVGEVVAPSLPVFTLVTTDEWFAVGNFRETELRAIPVGACATVYSMIDRTRAMHGIVQGIGWGVLDTDKLSLPAGVPYEQRELNWVRVAQRFPVRVQLQAPPEALVRLGASAVIEIAHGPACN
jgi:membrane fusion protein, multidrug efflux system